MNKEQNAALEAERFEDLEADCREMFHWVRGCAAYENGVKEIVRRAKARAQLAAPAGVSAEWAKLDPAFVVMFLRQSSAFDADLIGEMLNYAISAAAPSPAPASDDHVEDSRHMVSDPVQVPRELLVRHLREIGQYAWEGNTDEQLRALLNGGH
jgi:hypothetical protein